jgi:hypothetical protein
MPVAAVPILSGSSCCPCASQDGCNCGGGTCLLQCQLKSGITTLIGFSEFVDPSSPPKKYLNLTIDDDWLGCSFSSGNTSCSPETPFVGSYHTVQPVASYDSMTGVLTPAVAKACGVVMLPCVPHEINCIPFDQGDPPRPGAVRMLSKR